MRALIALFLLFSAVGCDSASDSGTYEGQLFDLEAEVAADLDLTFEIPDRGLEVTGLYQLSISIQAVPTTGSVRVVRRDNDSLYFELGPVIPDSGLSLEGVVRGDLLTGTWSVGTIAGPRPSGTFAAERR